jgi:hypothetical protein
MVYKNSKKNFIIKNMIIILNKKKDFNILLNK